MAVFLAQRELHKTKDGGLGSYLLFVMAHAITRRPRWAERQDAGRLLLDFIHEYAGQRSLDHIIECVPYRQCVPPSYLCHAGARQDGILGRAGWSWVRG